MNHRRVTTAASVWIFDLDLKRYIRFPRSEAPDQSSQVPYTGEWDEYTSLEMRGDRLLVNRPVPYGSGQLRMTGAILEDTHPTQIEGEQC